MAKKKAESCNTSAGRDMNGAALHVCERVEISPHFDLWMRGARFGTIRRVNKNGTISVKMDNTRVRRLQKMMPADVKKVR